MVTLTTTLRIRGTFIDFFPELKGALEKIRPASAPPRTNQHSESGDTDKYLSNLIVQTRSLPQAYLPIKRFHAAAPDENEHGGDQGYKDDISKESAPTTASRQFGSQSSTSDFDSEDGVPASNENLLHGRESNVTTNNDVASSFASSSVPLTTLMICGIPCRTCECDIVEMLAFLGFASAYDYLFVPAKQRGRGHKGCLGYAFVNFTSPQEASRFAVAFDSFSFVGAESTTSGYVKPATIQGYKANYKMRNASKWFRKHQRETD